MNYTSRQVRRIIEHYQEIRSSIEWVTSHVNLVRSRKGNYQKADDTTCLLVDIDNSLNSLTPRQYMIISMIKAGLTPEDIQKRVKLSVHTIKFHYDSAIFRILTYLNS